MAETMKKKISNHEAAACGTSLATVVVSYGTQRLGWMVVIT